MISIYRADTELMPSEEISLLADRKVFLELRHRETVEHAVAKVRESSNFQCVLLEASVIRFLSKEEVLMPSSKELSFE